MQGMNRLPQAAGGSVRKPEDLEDLKPLIAQISESTPEFASFQKSVVMPRQEMTLDLPHGV